MGIKADKKQLSLCECQRIARKLIAIVYSASEDALTTSKVKVRMKADGILRNKNKFSAGLRLAKK
jgi:hypothetical protein